MRGVAENWGENDVLREGEAPGSRQGGERERESGRVAGASLIYCLPQPRGRPLSETTPAKRQHIAYSEP